MYRSLACIASAGTSCSNTWLTSVQNSMRPLQAYRSLGDWPIATGCCESGCHLGRPALRPQRAGPPALRGPGLVRQARVRLFARGGHGPVAALQVEPRRHSARRPAVSRAGPAAHGAQLARGRGALRQAGHQQPRGFVRSKPRISVFHEDLKPSGGWGGLQLAPDLHGCGRGDALGPRLCDGAALEQQLSARS